MDIKVKDVDERYVTLCLNAYLDPSGIILFSHIFSDYKPKKIALPYLSCRSAVAVFNVPIKKKKQEN